MKIKLSEREIRKLRKLHRQLKNEGDAKSAYRANTIILLARGYGYSEVAQILLLDEATIRRYAEKYKEGGIDELLAHYYKPYEGFLYDDEIEILCRELDSKIYMEAKAVCIYISETFDVEYTERGCRNLLHRLGYVYKKPVGVPCKADAEKQRKFVKRYKRLRKKQKPGEVILFTDATHPTHNSVPVCGWIRKGEPRQLMQNTGRQRVNIIGTIDIDTKIVHHTLHKTVNTEAYIEHLSLLLQVYASAFHVRIFADNAKYVKNSKIFKFVRGTNIYIDFIPPYAPNLNLIERVWKLMKKVVRGNYFIETFKEFKKEILKFFVELPSLYINKLETLLSENFQIIELSN